MCCGGVSSILWVDDTVAPPNIHAWCSLDAIAWTRGAARRETRSPISSLVYEHDWSEPCCPMSTRGVEKVREIWADNLINQLVVGSAAVASSGETH